MAMMKRSLICSSKMTFGRSGLLVAPDVLAWVIAQDFVRNSLDMAIDERAVVVLFMALGDGVQVGGALGTPARIGAGIAIACVVAAEGEGKA